MVNLLRWVHVSTGELPKGCTRIFPKSLKDRLRLMHVPQWLYAVFYPWWPNVINYRRWIRSYGLKTTPAIMICIIWTLAVIRISRKCVSHRKWKLQKRLSEKSIYILNVWWKHCLPIRTIWNGKWMQANWWLRFSMWQVICRVMIPVWSFILFLQKKSATICGSWVTEDGISLSDRLLWPREKCRLWKPICWKIYWIRQIPVL